MSTTNGRPASDGNGHTDHATVADARPVVLVRYRPGITGETARTVHLIPLPIGGQLSATSALCGALLSPDEVEMVSPGEGMPCSGCAVSHLASTSPPPTTPPATTPSPDTPSTDPLTAAVDYQVWGWPVTLRRNQVWLSLTRDAMALMIPIPLSTEVAAILGTRRCPALVLTHPYAPHTGSCSQESRIRSPCPGHRRSTGSPETCCSHPPQPPADR